jgi:hypothetical protein
MLGFRGLKLGKFGHGLVVPVASFEVEFEDVGAIVGFMVGRSRRWFEGASKG